MKVYILLALVCVTAAFTIPSKQDVQSFIDQAKKDLASLTNIPDQYKAQLEELLNRPETQSYIAENFASITLRETVDPAERCLALYLYLISQLLNATTTTAAPQPTVV